MTTDSPLLQAYSRLSIEMVRGEGVYLYDSTGKQYLDFATGIAVTGLGHCHPHVVKAVQQQAETLWHCSNLFTIPEQVRLAKRLIAHTFAEKVFFCSSGLEAVETAIKLLRKFQSPKRYRIITLENGFHGRSLGTLSAGGNAIAREGFGPLLEGFDRIPRHDIAALKNAITDETAGILLEPIQAEGGVYPLDTDYLRSVRALADDAGILLCFDEVQCGYGRTGSLFRYQQIGVTPDILTAAKCIGNGFPLAACLTTDRVAAVITPGTHGSTYGGNPMAMAAGNAVLDVMEEPGFFAHVEECGAYFKTGLETLQKHHPDKIRAIRGVGLLLGVEVTGSARETMLRALENGLIITRAGGDSVLRILPPLIATKAHVDVALERLGRSL